MGKTWNRGKKHSNPIQVFFDQHRQREKNSFNAFVTKRFCHFIIFILFIQKFALYKFTEITVELKTSQVN